MPFSYKTVCFTVGVGDVDLRIDLRLVQRSIEQVVAQRRVLVPLLLLHCVVLHLGDVLPILLAETGQRALQVLELVLDGRLVGLQLHQLLLDDLFPPFLPARVHVLVHHRVDHVRLPILVVILPVREQLLIKT